MKYLKLYENYKLIDDVQNHVQYLIDDELAQRESVKLIGGKVGKKWIPTHYAIHFQTNLKSVCSTIEELEINKKIYDHIYQIANRFGSEFKLDSTNKLILYVEVSDSVRKFFEKFGENKECILFHGFGYTSLFVEVIEEDFSIVFQNNFYKQDIDEKFEFIKSQIQSQDFETELTKIDNKIILKLKK
jgi:hypothetical protein